jgi:subtilisin family serine protease
MRRHLGQLTVALGQASSTRSGMSRTNSSRIVAVLASGAMVAAGLAALASPAAVAADKHHGTEGVKVSKKDLSKLSGRAHTAGPRALDAKQGSREPGDALPAGVPAKGRYAFLLKLSTQSTHQAFQGAIGRGKAAAHTAAKSQLGAVTTAQNHVIGALPDKTRVLYRAHAVTAAVSVVTDVKNFQKLTRISGVSAVYPIAPKSPTNSYAVPLQHAPQAWEAHGNLGANSTVAIIDTGVDYTHANLGGVGTLAEYTDSKAQLGEPVSGGEFPGTKVIGGFDLAGDTYNADPADPAYNPVPSPDPWPLDCNGHGSHVAGTVAGYGENSDGTTYTGAYDTSTPFDTLRIGPGMAPHAKLYGFRVFGCEGSSDLVGSAIDMAADPNGDGDTSDHADVVNMSLGSDYGSPQDGDSQMTEWASGLGMTMVVASGNAGDLYDVGGSPGDAPSALTVAASQDAYAQVDSLNVSAPGSIAGSYAAERSIAYDWAGSPDLSGDVVRLTDPGNLDGCDPLSPADDALVDGKVVFLEWTDDDTVRRCGSKSRGDRLAAAGASGFIFGDDSESFAGGITGSVDIPGVLVAKSGADAIRTELQADNVVSISGTTANGFSQMIPALDDTIAGFSSRGIGDAGNVKPDVTAVGGTVFSTGSGTGNEGINESGTSMATPMVAGTAALVKTAHPDWSAKQTKADIMNTAGTDITQGPTKFAPQRVGTGRIQVDGALDNDVLAYVTDDGGAVSASFGPQALTGTTPTVLHKTIKVQNTGLSTRSYDVTFEDRSTVPGADYSVSPASITLDPKSSKTVTLTLTLDPTQLTKTNDPTVDLFQGGLPRQFQADASGLVNFTATSGGPDLRVSAYVAPRPASDMTQAGSLTLPAGDVQEALLPLTGQPVNQGGGSETVQSIVAGFELQAKSGPAPTCGGPVTDGCVNFSDERSADLKAVGATSDAPQLVANGQDPLTDGFVYFAINTQGRWRTASSSQEFDIYIDGDGDGTPDVVAYNTRFPDTDILVSELVDLSNGHVLDDELINASFGDTDTAAFDSDTLVMPVWLGAIPGLSADQSRINYAVYSFSPYQGNPVDAVGDPEWLSFDVLNPGIALFGSYDGSASPLLFPDAPSSVLNVRRDSAAYAADGGLGAMVVHFHNVLGEKTQLVKLKNVPTLGLTLAPNPAGRGQQVTATVTVPDTAGTAATGSVVLKAGATTLGTGDLADGTAHVTFARSAAGVYPVHAEYAGDDTHDPGVSATVNLTVEKTTPTIGLSLSRTKVHPGQRIRATVRITTVAGIAATGPVSIRRPNGRVLARGEIVDGVAVLKWRNHRHHGFKVRAVYRGDANYLGGTSAYVKVKVTG